MKNLLDSPFFAFIISIFIVFFITIWDSTLTEAIAGSLFLGFLMTPLMGIAFGLIDFLLP